MATIYPANKRENHKGLEIEADYFTGSLNGTVAGALTGQTPVTITATTGTLPTPNGSVTIANAATPTVTELQEAVVELNAKIAAIIAALD